MVTTLVFFIALLVGLIAANLIVIRVQKKRKAEADEQLANMVRQIQDEAHDALVAIEQEQTYWRQRRITALEAYDHGVRNPIQRDDHLHRLPVFDTSNREEPEEEEDFRFKDLE